MSLLFDPMSDAASSSSDVDVSILIVSYNTRAMTLRCLETLYESLERDDALTAEVLVADNGSSDGSLEAIEEQFPQARIVSRDDNLGFAKANNVLAREARGEWILLLNPDTEVLGTAVQTIVAFGESKRADGQSFVVGGRTLFADGSLNRNSCHGRPTPWSLFCQGTGLSSMFRTSALFNPEGLGSWKRDSVREVDAITGCLLLIERRLWEKLGGFDERFVMYGEDTDLCLRASSAGVPSIVCPDSEIIHHGGASEAVRSDKMIRLFRAKAQLIKKHWSPASAFFGTRALIAWAMTRMVAHAVLVPIRKASAPAYATWREIVVRRAEFQLKTRQ